MHLEVATQMHETGLTQESLMIANREAFFIVYRPNYTHLIDFKLMQQSKAMFVNDKVAASESLNNPCGYNYS